MKNIPTITIFGNLHTFIGMDIIIWPTYPKMYVQTFILEKVWLRNTLPNYNLYICPKFRSFFFWILSLADIKYNIYSIIVGMISILPWLWENLLFVLSAKCSGIFCPPIHVCSSVYSFEWTFQDFLIFWQIDFLTFIE